MKSGESKEFTVNGMEDGAEVTVSSDDKELSKLYMQTENLQ